MRPGHIQCDGNAAVIGVIDYITLFRSTKVTCIVKDREEALALVISRNKPVEVIHIDGHDLLCQHFHFFFYPIGVGAFEDLVTLSCLCPGKGAILRGINQILVADQGFIGSILIDDIKQITAQTVDQHMAFIAVSIISTVEKQGDQVFKMPVMGCICCTQRNIMQIDTTVFTDPMGHHTICDLNTRTVIGKNKGKGNHRLHTLQQRPHSSPK